MGGVQRLGWLVAVGVVGLGCLPSEPSLAGKLCNATAECRSSQLACIGGRCLVPGSLEVSLSTAQVTVSRGSEALWLERRLRDGGVPDAPEAVRVTAPGPGQVSNAAADWNSQVEVTFAPGSTRSSTFLFRSPDAGPTTLGLTVEEGIVARGGLEVMPEVARLDGEGTLFVSDTPRGPFDEVRVLEAGNGLGLSPDAGHRGERGLRLVDGISAAGSTPIVAGFIEVLPVSPRVFMRGWVRVTASNGQGSLVLWLAGGPGTPLSLYLELDTRRYAVGGDSLAGVPFTYERSNLQFQVGEWHLVEVAADNLGGEFGLRTLWVDGVLQRSRTGIPLQGVFVQRVQLGEPWTDDNRFSGIVDMDDVRLSVLAPASRLVVEPTSGPSGACVPVSVGLLDSTGAPSRAPYEVRAQLTPVALAVFSDSGCTQATQTVTFGWGAKVVTVWARREGAGPSTLAATHADFLSGPAANITTAP